MSEASHKGVIAWFARNPVAANLLMLFIFNTKPCSTSSGAAPG